MKDGNPTTQRRANVGKSAKWKIISSVDFLAAVTLLLAAAGIAAASYYLLYPVDAFIGPFQVYHWASIAGAAIIAFFIPLYVALKRYYPKMRKRLFGSHMYVNLAAFVLVSAHFGILGQIKPDVDTGTGFLQYSVVGLLVFSGIMRRFSFFPGTMRIWRFLHVSLVLSFYVILIDHVLGAIRLL